MSDEGIGEFAAIEQIRLLLPQPPEGETWIGDDAAVVAVPPRGRLLLATDAVVEGVHFDLDLVEASDVGWKALAVNVSDIAAMGGRPLHALVTVIGADSALLEGVMTGIRDAAAEYRCAVVGGDISTGLVVAVAVAVTGTTGGRAAVLRSGARAGDALYVTGPLGRSAAGLRTLRGAGGGSATKVPAPLAAALAAAYRRPVARVAEGDAASAAAATAMIDVSDGLGIDLDHLATASRVGVVLDEVPVAEGASLDEALSGGEDYELVFAAGDEGAVTAAFDAAGARRPIRIGRCVEDPGIRRLGAGPLPVTGWEHRLRRR